MKMATNTTKNSLLGGKIPKKKNLICNNDSLNTTGK